MKKVFKILLILSTILLLFGCASNVIDYSDPLEVTFGTQNYDVDMIGFGFTLVNKSEIEGISTIVITLNLYKDNQLIETVIVEKHYLGPLGKKVIYKICNIITSHDDYDRTELLVDYQK